MASVSPGKNRGIVKRCGMNFISVGSKIPCLLEGYERAILLFEPLRKQRDPFGLQLKSSLPAAEAMVGKR